ncbi:MAG: hypothetical protein HC836_12745 [Richelia sp. RM2_1_2]|nr:hypothetical protein [Richelia sp. RM2_1_2]
MLIKDIADEIFHELDEPEDLSIASISFWLQRNIGSLNSSIFTCYYLNKENGELNAELSEDEIAIFKKLFFIFYYGKQVKKSLHAASFDHSVIEVQEMDRKIRVTNKNEVAKVWQQAKKDAMEELEKLKGGYKRNRANPKMVTGDDDEIGQIIHKDDFGR